MSRDGVKSDVTLQQEIFTMELFDFAFCPTFNANISLLAEQCSEKWSFGENTDNIILVNYINHTFKKVFEEGKVISTDTYAVFNTGLYDKYYEPICAYFVNNSVYGRQKWKFISFSTPYELANRKIYKIPERANYFKNPAALVFDTNCNIILQYKHIFEDKENRERIPVEIRDKPNMKNLFDGALIKAKNMINANYKTAVPQYYDGKIQLLVPLYLLENSSPDLALVVSKEQNTYIGHTCLTLAMAYNNARLIARPDDAWLRP
jgi:hypothetical protein